MVAGSAIVVCPRVCECCGPMAGWSWYKSPSQQLLWSSITGVWCPSQEGLHTNDPPQSDNGPRSDWMAQPPPRIPFKNLDRGVNIFPKLLSGRTKYKHVTLSPPHIQSSSGTLHLNQEALQWQEQDNTPARTSLPRLKIQTIVESEIAAFQLDPDKLSVHDQH